MKLTWRSVGTDLRPLVMVVLLALILGLTVIVSLGILKTTSLTSPFRRVELRIAPAVVNIAAEKVVRVNQPTRNELDEYLQREPQSRPSLRHQHMLGTGFIFDERGYVLTNYHVISGYDDISIHLADGTEFNSDSVRKIGVDPWSDLAVLKIESRRRLPVVRLGNSDKLEIGDWAAAIGNPFGLSGTVTAGVISGFNRSGVPISHGPQFQDFIQTDAAINPGNSGGPLVDENGLVVGVNTAIRSPVAGSVGIGFAIPINFAQDVAAELIQNGRVVRGYLGMDTQPIDDPIQAALGLKDRNGVLVSAVLENGPAARAGVKPGDVVLAFDNQPVTDIQQFQALAAGSEPGSTVNLALKRRNAQLIAAVPVAPRYSSEPPAISPLPTRHWLGLSVRPIVPAEVQRLGASAGVVVDTVEPGSPADDARLQVGDLVVEIDGNAVRDVAAYTRLAVTMEKAGKPLLFRILRARQGVYVGIEPNS